MFRLVKKVVLWGIPILIMSLSSSRNYCLFLKGPEYKVIKIKVIVDNDYMTFP